MAKFFIPKIEFNPNDIDSDIILDSTTITANSSTSRIEVGMRITSSNFPSDTLVVGVTASEIEVSNGATENGSAVTVGFTEFIDFELPPKGDTFGESLRHVGTTNTSKSGLTFSFTDYIDKTFKITFSHMTQEIKEKLEDFLVTWAFFGKEFNYFFDQDDDLTKILTEINARSKRNSFKVVSRRGDGLNFSWVTTLNFRTFS